MTRERLDVTERTRLRRRHQRGSYDLETLYAVLDATPLCSVAYVIDGKPVVTPTLQWREGDTVYWHGSSASRALRAADGMDVCLAVAQLDGWVLARSAFHHSANYRSAMLFGRATRVPDALKEQKLRAFIEGLYPGRWETLRPVTPQELKATTLLGLPIREASAKVRAEGVVDDEEDYRWPVWAGVLPVGTVLGAAEPDPRNLPDLAEPAYLDGPARGPAAPGPQRGPASARD